MMIDSVDTRGGRRLTKSHAGRGLLPSTLAFVAAVLAFRKVTP